MKQGCSRIRGSLALAAAGLWSAHAAAITGFDVFPQPIAQQGLTPHVSVGLIVWARSNLNQLAAGGGFTMGCPPPAGLPVHVDRYLTDYQFTGPTDLWVTVPQYLPATRVIPGFYDLKEGTIVDCTYQYKGSAREGGYSVSGRGFTFSLGYGETSRSDTIVFTVRKPVSKTGGCVP